MKKITHILTLCILAALIAGCASSAPPRYYMLDPVSVPGTVQKADFSVSVGPISVPASIDRQQIVTRTGSNQVHIEEYERWASPLKENIGRVVVQNLVSLLGTNRVTLFPETSAAGASCRVVIDVMRFDSELGKAVTLDAGWTVSCAKSGQSYRGRTTLTEAAQGKGYSDIVAAHSRALGKLSADLAENIRQVEK